MSRIVITGHKSGLGRWIAQELEAAGNEIIGWSLPDVDVRSKNSVYEASRKIDRLDILINCAGVNSIEYLPLMLEDEWDRVMDTNAKGIFLTSQALAYKLRGGTILNIVSNASHVPMTASAAYNASKGAASILTKQLSRELIKTHDITVFAISPNKLSGTGMTEDIDEAVCRLRGWTREQARAYQLASLPAGEETDPQTLAEFITFLLSTKQRHKYLAGCDIPYGL
jgi:NAD(P)-dependent dehydrogenase (short-subunit alcohol dehydrogenase family)